MLNMKLCFVPPTPNLGILVILYQMTLFQIISRSVALLKWGCKGWCKSCLQQYWSTSKSFSSRTMWSCFGQPGTPPIMNNPDQAKQAHLSAWSILLRQSETLPSLTSDMGKKKVSVLAHKYLLPQRTLIGISPLRYSRWKPCAGGQISVLPHVLST